MSFSVEVKREITTLPLKPCCQRAQLSAFLHINSTLLIINRGMKLQIKTENATIAKYLFSGIKERYEVEIELSVEKKQHLKKNNIYILTILDKAIEILEDLGIYSSKGMRNTPFAPITLNECCKRSYLTGAFLASGSINAPNRSDYHMEISTLDEKLSEFVLMLMNHDNLNAKLVKRRNRYVAYVKQADKIGDFLRICQAHNNLMKFEDERIQRDFRNSLTRLDNCEVANEMKTIKAGNSQIDDIQLLIKNDQFQHIDEKLVQVATLRMDHPEASLNELLEEYKETYGVTLSKSGLQHRFKKISELAKAFH